LNISFYAASKISPSSTTVREVFEAQPVILHGGYLDTTDGLFLTSADALELAREKGASDQAKRAEAARSDAQRAEQQAKERVHEAHVKFEKLALCRRVSLCNVPKILLSPLSLLRQIIKHCIARRRVQSCHEHQRA